MTLADDTERFRLAPVMHQVAEIEAFVLWSSGAVELPDELSADLIRMATGMTLAQRLGAAATPTGTSVRRRWRAPRCGRTARGGAAGQARIARVMRRSYALAYEQAGGT